MMITTAVIAETDVTTLWTYFCIPTKGIDSAKDRVVESLSDGRHNVMTAKTLSSMVADDLTNVEVNIFISL